MDRTDMQYNVVEMSDMEEKRYMVMMIMKFVKKVQNIVLID